MRNVEGTAATALAFKVTKFTLTKVTVINMEAPSGIALPGPDRNHLWTWIHVCAVSVAKPLVTDLTSGNLAELPLNTIWVFSATTPNSEAPEYLEVMSRG